MFYLFWLLTKPVIQKKGTTVEVLTINMIPKDFAREIYVGLDQEPESYILIASTLSALCKTWINQCSSN